MHGEPCAELSGAYQVALPSGSKARIELDGIVFQVSAVNAGRVVAGHVQVDTHSLLYQGLSLAVHAIVRLVWPRFELHEPGPAVPVFEPGPIAGRLLAGLELRFGDPW